jgi:PHS family inorganic phosphate transporter-like MFS transporter
MTTFIVPAEAFPTRARATGHGISAASGKMGAAIGAALMPLLVSGGAGMDVRGLMNAMWMCTAVCLTGFAWTWYLTKETGGVDLEVLDAQQRNVSGSAR